MYEHGMEPDPLCVIELADLIRRVARTSERRAFWLAEFIDRTYRRNP
jgi:hypothetical protein